MAIKPALIAAVFLSYFSASECVKANVNELQFQPERLVIEEFHDPMFVSRSKPCERLKRLGVISICGNTPLYPPMNLRWKKVLLHTYSAKSSPLPSETFLKLSILWTATFFALLAILCISQHQNTVITNAT